MWKPNESDLDGLVTSDLSPSSASAEPSGRSAPQAPTRGSAILGQSIVITGEIKGNEDLTIEGRVEGTIESKQHFVTIGPKATAKVEIFAKNVVVLGKVDGNITASDKVEIRPKGTVKGDIVSPTVAIAEGAMFRGSIDMQATASVPPAAETTDKRPVQRPAPAAKHAALR